jgi:hypothetical protein
MYCTIRRQVLATAAEQAPRTSPCKPACLSPSVTRCNAGTGPGAVKSPASTSSTLLRALIPH